MATEAEMSGLPREIDTSRPHSARMYDYYLGGKNHLAADRETADAFHVYGGVARKA